MLKIITAVCFAVLAVPAQAETCPEFYRFVDFGLAESDGVLRRGGETFRGFITEGISILDRTETVCLEAEETSKDGRRLIIPIVSKIMVDTKLAGLNLQSLMLETVANAAFAASQNAQAHQERLGKEGTTLTQGDNYLCASSDTAQELSCQVISPYKDNTDLVVYCDTQVCMMPVLAYGARLAVSATWDRAAVSPHETASEIIQQVQALHEFFKGHF